MMLDWKECDITREWIADSINPYSNYFIISGSKQNLYFDEGDRAGMNTKEIGSYANIKVAKAAAELHELNFTHPINL